MTDLRELYWGWPGWGHFRYALLLALAQGLWFALIYGGADYLTGLHPYRVQLNLDAEVHMPFVPAMVLGYMAVYPLFVLAPFILRKRRQIEALTLTLAAVTLFAGVCFLVFPGERIFPPEEDLGGWDGMVDFARQIALHYNYMPSLHVTLSAVCVMVYAGRAGQLGKVLLWSWSLLISVSTLLLHQHYLVDVVTGYMLAWAGVRWVYRRWADKSEPQRHRGTEKKRRRKVR